MNVVDDHAEERRVRQIPTRVPTQVDGLTSLRTVARAMVESGVHAVLVESPVGPTGLVAAKDVIEALAGGADPDVVWAGEIMRPAPRIVSCEQLLVDVGEEMAAYDLEIVAVVDEDARMGVASALDILGAIVRAAREPTSRKT
jgi:CBS domain-containing protein